MEREKELEDSAFARITVCLTTRGPGSAQPYHGPTDPSGQGSD